MTRVHIPSIPMLDARRTGVAGGAATLQVLGNDGRQRDVTLDHGGHDGEGGRFPAVWHERPSAPRHESIGALDRRFADLRAAGHEGAQACQRVAQRGIGRTGTDFEPPLRLA